jgi:hypothetical protein
MRRADRRPARGDGEATETGRRARRHRVVLSSPQVVDHALTEEVATGLAARVEAVVTTTERARARRKR